MKKVLSIAGSDCSGVAGIQADLKTFSAHGFFVSRYCPCCRLNCRRKKRTRSGL